MWVALLAAGTSEQSPDALTRARDRDHDMIRDALVPHIPNETVDDITALLIDGVVAAALEFHLDGDRAALRRRLNTLAAMVRMTATPAGITP